MNRSCSVSTGCRSSTSRTRTSRCAGARRRIRTAMSWCSTARSTTTWSCGPSCAEQHGAVFATDGDGEAILAAYHYWGTEALTRLRGMFAFALWDSRDQRTVLRPGPVRHQAAVHGDRAGRHRRRQREEVSARPGPRAGPGHPDRRARRAALHGAAVRAGAGDAAPRDPPAGVGLLRGDPPRRGAEDQPVLLPALRRRRRSPPAPSRPATTRSPRCSRTRWPSTCAPT